MLKLNLINLEQSDIKYSVSRFPDGEVQITLGEFSRKDFVEVSCRVTNAEELFILMQVADVLNRHGVEWLLKISYLMGMRMDRVMDFNRPFTLKVVADIIRNLGAGMILVFEPHSERTLDLLGASNMNPNSDTYWEFDPSDYKVYENYLVAIPDTGAYERYKFSNLRNVLRADKVRNQETGKIESITLVNSEVLETDARPIMVVDDLCDAGGTFVGLAAEIRKYTDREINVFVTHMVNRKGIENLSKAYNHVYFTNSYKDWENLPENVTQINIV